MPKKSVFQKAADWFSSLVTPKWLVALLGEIQDIIVSIMLQVGKEYLKQIQDKIVEVAQADMPNKDRFNIVFKFTKSLIPDIKDSACNLLVEALVNKLKAAGFLRIA